MLSKISSFFKKLFAPKPPPTILKYSATYTEEGKLSDETRAEVAKIKAADLKPGDQYQLGPNATATVAPEGLKGKAWVAARVKASEERRRVKYELWWAEKRERCLQIMMMSEQELIDSGVKAEVDKFLSENQQFLAWAEQKNLLPKEALTKLRASNEAAAPSGDKDTRTKEAFAEIFKQVEKAAEEILIPAGLEGFVKDGKLVDATPEVVAAYKSK